MDVAATEGRHLTCKPKKKASVQFLRCSNRAPPAGPSLRSGVGGTGRQPLGPHQPVPPPSTPTGPTSLTWTCRHRVGHTGTFVKGQKRKTEERPCKMQGTQVWRMGSTRRAAGAGQRGPSGSMLPRASRAGAEWDAGRGQTRLGVGKAPLGEPQPGCALGRPRGTDRGWRPGGPGTGRLEMQSPGPSENQNHRLTRCP